MVETCFSDLQLLSDDGAVVRVPLSELTRVQVLDAGLHLELQRALAAQLESRRPAPRPCGHASLSVVYAARGGPIDDEAELRIAYAQTTKEWM
jgi:hypothetical protein